MAFKRHLSEQQKVIHKTLYSVKDYQARITLNFSYNRNSLGG